MSKYKQNNPINPKFANNNRAQYNENDSYPSKKRDYDENYRRPRYDRHASKEEDFEVPEHLSETSDIVPYNDFADMNLKEPLLRGIYGYGFQKPSTIQSLAVIPISEKHDLVAQSQAGTGKTGAFTIGVLNLINEGEKTPQAIIMCNTRELADQIFSVISELGKFMKINISLAIGGTNVQRNAGEVAISHIVIGTPGRISDLLKRGAINSEKLKVFVIDEADELLQGEFLDQTKNIIHMLAEGTQMCIFSATLPKNVLDLTNEFMNKPKSILIKREKLSLDAVTQYYIDVIKEENKLEILEELYSKLSINQCIIYVNSIEKVELLNKELSALNHEVLMIHGNMDNIERINIMKRFRSGEARILITTDLTSRGIDIQTITCVINYDLPKNRDAYLHRIGRTGRYGKRGIAISFATRFDNHVISDIERRFRTKIYEMPEISSVNMTLE